MPKRRSIKLGCGDGQSPSRKHSSNFIAKRLYGEIGTSFPRQKAHDDKGALVDLFPPTNILDIKDRTGPVKSTLIPNALRDIQQDIRKLGTQSASLGRGPPNNLLAAFCLVNKLPGAFGIMAMEQPQRRSDPIESPSIRSATASNLSPEIESLLKAYQCFPNYHEDLAPDAGFHVRLLKAQDGNANAAHIVLQCLRERLPVWHAAQEYAVQHGLKLPKKWVFPTDRHTEVPAKRRVLEEVWRFGILFWKAPARMLQLAYVEKWLEEKEYEDSEGRLDLERRAAADEEESLYS